MTEVRELRFGHQRRRVWLDGLPPCEVVAEHWLQARQAAALGLVSLTRAAAEFFSPTNHAHFGILGGSFTASANSSVNVRVVVSNSCEKQVDWSLTWQAERVFTGLPAAYAEAVLSSALSALREFPLGPGTLVFDHAAHVRSARTSLSSGGWRTPLYDCCSVPTPSARRATSAHCSRARVVERRLLLGGGDFRAGARRGRVRVVLAVGGSRAAGGGA